MGAVFLGTVFLIATILVFRWYSQASTETIWKILKWFGVISVSLAGIFLILRGGLQFLWVFTAFLLPWILRIRGLRNLIRAAKPKSPGQTSSVRTRYVAMNLNHDTGEMDGEVLEGPFMGKCLTELNLEQLLSLFELANREDTQSAQVINSYIDRNHGPELRRRRATSGGENYDDVSSSRDGNQMSLDEAFVVLGLEKGASDDEIKAAHRYLISKYHPDRGGSDYLAAKINAAKELLLKSK